MKTTPAPRSNFCITLTATLCLLSYCIHAQETGKTNTPPAQPPVSFVSRSQWGAKAPVGEMRRHKIERITIHHTATIQKRERTLEQKMVALQQFSQNEGKLGSGKLKPAWPDVPYHYYIDVSGRVAEGRQIGYVGDTNTEYNPEGHALVVLEGNFEQEQPSKEQVASMQAMVQWLADRFKVPSERIQAHDDFAKTACPGKNLKAMLPDVRKGLKNTTQTGEKS